MASPFLLQPISKVVTATRANAPVMSVCVFVFMGFLIRLNVVGWMDCLLLGFGSSFCAGFHRTLASLRIRGRRVSLGLSTPQSSGFRARDKQKRSQMCDIRATSPSPDWSPWAASSFSLVRLSPTAKARLVSKTGPTGVKVPSDSGLSKRRLPPNIPACATLCGNR